MGLQLQTADRSSSCENIQQVAGQAIGDADLIEVEERVHDGGN